MWHLYAFGLRDAFISFFYMVVFNCVKCDICNDIVLFNRNNTDVKRWLASCFESVILMDLSPYACGESFQSRPEAFYSDVVLFSLCVWESTRC